MDSSFSNKEKLKSNKLIEQLFTEGNSITIHPWYAIYIATTFDSDIKIKTGVSVSKRNFKKAVDRNRIKRLLREVYRLQKPIYFNNITTQYAFMFLYIGTDKPDFGGLETKMRQLFDHFLKKAAKG